MPSLLMSPSTVGLRPARSAPGETVAAAGGIAGAPHSTSRSRHSERAARQVGAAARPGTATSAYQPPSDPPNQGERPTSRYKRMAVPNVTRGHGTGLGSVRARSPGRGAEQWAQAQT